MKKILSVAIISVVLISGCGGSITGNVLKMSLPSSETAKDIVPQKINNYETVNTDELISKASGVAAALAVSSVSGISIQSVYAKQFTEKFVTCYQEAGAVNSKGYYRTDNPFYGGSMIVFDKNKITDPATIWTCVKKAGLPFSIYGEEFKPCALKFTIENTNDGNKFYVVGFGTDISVCQDICKSMMDGKIPNYDFDNMQCK